MSLDNTSQLGGQGLDELVPSRYALQVGDIDVLVISDGVLPITAPTLAYNADSADLAAWLDDMFLPPDVLEWPLNVVVVRSGSQTVLIDAGLGVEFPDFPRAGRLALRLEAAGIDPASVTDVVLTHMHMDHIGGLLAEGLKGRLRPACASTRRPPKPSSGSRPISPTPPCRRGCQTRFGRPPRNSWTSTAASCGPSRRSTRWRQGWSPVAPATTPPGTAWSAWRPAATG